MKTQMGDGVVRLLMEEVPGCSGNREGRQAFRPWEAVGSFVDHGAGQQSLRRNVSGAEQDGCPGRGNGPPGKARQGEATSNWRRRWVFGKAEALGYGGNCGWGNGGQVLEQGGPESQAAEFGLDPEGDEKVPKHLDQRQGMASLHF